MGVIHDMTEKIKNWNPAPSVAIYAEKHAEKLTCCKCGKVYVSRGKHDPGFCRECEEKQNAQLIGGPFDGEKAYDQQN